MTPEQREALVERIAAALDPQPFERTADGQQARARMNIYDATTARSDRRRMSKARKQANTVLSIAEGEIERRLIEEMMESSEAVIRAGSDAVLHAIMVEGPEGEFPHEDCFDLRARFAWQAMLHAFHSSRGE